MTRYTQTRKKRTKKIGENEQAVRSRRRLVARPLTNSGEYMADSEYDEREREREQNEDGNEWIGGYQSGIDLSAAGFQKNSEPGIGTEITRFQGLNLIGGVVMERGISEVSRGETTSGETRPPSFELADSSRRVLVLVPMYNISTLGQTGNMHRPVAVVVRDNSHVVPVESLPDILNMAGSSAVVSSLHSSDH
ncbi:hypothetical protein HK100_000973 [Physocladia obscura]|uniref:Uncharacterized protein n=1 Tax=Physocladia obscura TaxID=109957 RepID=A0AAD5T0D6_9FUNG|nr:hypothetical protein HK100_000973 [Physocladia obscura]